MKSSLSGLIALSGVLSATAHAQSGVSEPQVAPAVPPLIIDRPDFTESAQTVPRGMIQVEAGASFERSGTDKATTIGETLILVASGDRAEIRIGIPSYINLRGGGAKENGFGNAFLGAKFALIQREDFPISILVGTTLPTGSRKVTSREFNAEAALATETALSEKLVWRSTPIMEIPTKATGAPASSLAALRWDSMFRSASAPIPRFSLSIKTSATAIPSNTSMAASLNAAKPNLQFDARLGFGLGNKSGGPDYFTGVGVSQRF